MTPLYTSSVNAIGGRAGHVKSSDGTIDLPLSMPKGLGGPETPGTTNPEQLFAAGYAACFGGAVGLVGRTQKINLGAHDITAKVSIGKDDTGFGLAVELVGHFPELAREQAEGVMKAAHEVCPYSKATRGNIEVTLSVA
ncbi:MAG: organic hydroperoxide resistance protein [Myxococcales bacterium]|jgi:osmotically inducible protein OsmC|nr:organic hydroperoxide resistance protein [Myxococcales bacterium]